MASSSVSRVAVVTGGASGLGLSICRHLARQGRRVAVLDIDGDAAERVARDLRAERAEAMSARVDVSDRATVDASYDEVRAGLGRIEIVVTSAAVASFTAFEGPSCELMAREPQLRRMRRCRSE